MLEPGVGFEVGVGSRVAGIGVEAEHGLDEFFGAAILEVPREFHVALDDALVDVVGILGVASEGQLADHELEQHHAYRPQVDQLVVLLAEDDFGSHVVRSADDRAGSVQLVDDLGRPEGDQPQIPSFVNNEVVRLQVSDHDLLAHEVLEEKDQGGSVELSVGCAQEADFSDGVVEAFSVHVLGDSKDGGGVFIDRVEDRDEGMGGHFSHAHLLPRYFHQPSFLQLRLSVQLAHLILPCMPQEQHRILGRSPLFSHHHHFPEVQLRTLDALEL